MVGRVGNRSLCVVMVWMPALTHSSSHPREERLCSCWHNHLKCNARCQKMQWHAKVQIDVRIDTSPRSRRRRKQVLDRVTAFHMSMFFSLFTVDVMFFKNEQINYLRRHDRMRGVWTCESRRTCIRTYVVRCICIRMVHVCASVYVLLTSCDTDVSWYVGSPLLCGFAKVTVAIM